MIGFVSSLIPSAFKFGKQFLQNRAETKSNEFDVKREHIKNLRGWRTSLIVVMIFLPFIFITIGVFEGMIYQIYWWICGLFNSCNDHLTAAVDIVKSTNSYAGTFLFVELMKNLGVDYGALLTNFIYVGLPIVGGMAGYKAVQKNTMMKQAQNDHLLKPTSQVKKPVRKPNLDK